MIKEEPRLLSKNTNKNIDFLFVSYGGGHLKALLPIAENLIKDGYEIYYFALTAAILEIKKTNIPFFSYADLNDSLTPQNIELGTKLAYEQEHANNKKNSINNEETIAYLSLNYLDLVSQYGEKEARKKWLKSGRQAFHPLNLMTKIIEYIKPKMVISTNSPRSERASIEAASNLGIKSVCINDLFAIRQSNWLKKKEFANKVFVLNESVRNYLIKKGRPASDIVASGNPAFDELFDKRFYEEGKRIRRQMGLGRNINILYASTDEQKINRWTGEKGDVNLPKKIEAKLREYIKKNKKINLIIRRHPSQSLEVKKGDRVFQSNQDQNINAILNAADIIIHSASTVGLQAALIGKSVINIELSTISSDLPLTSMNLGRSLFSLDEMEKVIDDEILSLSESEKKNRKNNFKISATKTITEEIYKILKKTT